MNAELNMGTLQTALLINDIVFAKLLGTTLHRTWHLERY